MLVLSLVETVGSFEGTRRGNISLGGGMGIRDLWWLDKGQRDRNVKEEKVLQYVYFGLSYIGKLWPKKVNRIRETLGRFNNVHSYQVRKNNDLL